MSLCLEMARRDLSLEKGAKVPVYLGSHFQPCMDILADAEPGFCPSALPDSTGLCWGQAPQQEAWPPSPTAQRLGHCFWNVVTVC